MTGPLFRLASTGHTLCEAAPSSPTQPVSSPKHLRHCRSFQERSRDGQSARPVAMMMMMTEEEEEEEEAMNALFHPGPGKGPAREQHSHLYTMIA